MRVLFVFSGACLLGASGLAKAATIPAGKDEHWWDGVVGAIDSCDDLFAPELEVEGTLTFLQPIDCGTHKVRSTSEQHSTPAVVVDTTRSRLPCLLYCYNSFMVGFKAVWCWTSCREGYVIGFVSNVCLKKRGQ